MNETALHLCSNCFNSMGTRRETVLISSVFKTTTIIKRQCKISGMLVDVTGPSVGSCGSWRPKPSEEVSRRMANDAANQRINHIPAK